MIIIFYQSNNRGEGKKATINESDHEERRSWLEKRSKDLKKCLIELEERLEFVAYVMRSFASTGDWEKTVTHVQEMNEASFSNIQFKS